MQGHPEPAPGFGAGAQGAAEHRRPFAHPDQAVPRPVARRGGAAAVVLNRDRETGSVPRGGDDGGGTGDSERARLLLLATIEAAGEDVAHHALYITGERLYPGFELDELLAPVIAVGRYIAATGEEGIAHHPVVARLRRWVLRELEMWRGPHGLYGTFLLPTDDPTDYPYVATVGGGSRGVAGPA